MKKYKKIRTLGHRENENIFTVNDDKIIIQEKLDGSNFRFWREGDKLIFGSRNVNNLDKNNHQFSATINYLKEKIDVDKLDPDIIYIGEAMKKHSINYDWGNIPKFIGYDVVYKDNGLPLSYKLAIKEFNKIGLEFVRVIFEGTAYEVRNNIDLNSFLDKDSPYREAGRPEGIVIKNYDRLNQFGRPLYAKMVRDDFKEKNKVKFDNKKTKKRDALYITEKYATEARIKKIILKMVNNEGKNLSRELMNSLIPKVIKDILSESIIEIYEEDKRVNRIDFNMLHELVPKKCLRVLDNMIANNTNGGVIDG